MLHKHSVLIDMLLRKHRNTHTHEVLISHSLTQTYRLIQVINL